MLRKLTSVAYWFNADPRRLQIALITVFFLLAVAALVLPNLIAIAGEAPGGSR